MTAEKTKEQFIKAYNEYSDEIFRFCFFRLYDRAQAREITQETFTKMWKYLTEGKTVDNFRALAYKMARNLVIDFKRKKQEESLENLQTNGFDVIDNGKCKQQDYLDVISAIQEIDKLGEKYSEIIKMKYIDGLLTKEIAVAVGISESAVSVRIHRGMEKIKLNLESL